MTALPAGACDSHVHVFDPDHFPYAPDRAYTPGPAGCEALQQHMARLGLGRCVLVQPSVYGTDNRCLLSALQALGPQVSRGVAVIDPQTVSDAELEALHAAGIRAVRVNFEAGGGKAVGKLATIQATARRLSGTGMAVQLYVDTATAAAAVQAVREVPLILDHYAGFKAGTEVSGRDFTAILRTLESGRVWVKLSAPYRCGCRSPDYSELRPAAEAMIEAAPQRMVWASDWPHTGGGADRAARSPDRIEPFRQIDSNADLGRLRAWVADDARMVAILTANPATLFDFPSFA
ncbi:Predicted metal-dependent hydrolase, TIM-barrel fold [Paracoccus pantotrophus]|nr:Predicted metal-dependent hydrolase, TIM-barrel fold [Paracoccus pantotrophus]